MKISRLTTVIKTLKTNRVFFVCLTLMFIAGSTTPPLALVFTLLGFFMILFYSPVDRI